jgi:hypothetical protein
MIVDVREKIARHDTLALKQVVTSAKDMQLAKKV